MLTFREGILKTTMRHFQLAVCVLAFAVIGSAQEKPQNQTPTEPTASPTAGPSNESTTAKSASPGPAVDGAKVSGATFSSEFFKFSYQLPKDWKALDDSVRMSENQKLQNEDNARAMAPPAPKKKVGTSTTAKNPAFVPRATSSTERYSLMAASSEAIDSLDSPVLPRINIWAHRKVPPLDSLDDHAQYLSATKRAVVLQKPKEVSISGHTFMRVDIIAPGGIYHSQFVTIVGDYLVGFDFLTTSQAELSSVTATIDTVKFQ